MKLNYVDFDFPRRSLLHSSGLLKCFAEADVVVFDCDGVLLDVRESYKVQPLRRRQSSWKP